jgi:peptide/nickel transport system substrate-binding protein
MVELSRRRSGASRAAVGLVLAGLILSACTSSSTPAPTAAPSAGASSAASKAPSAAPTIASVKFAGAGPVLTLDVTKSGDLVSVDMIILSQGNLVRHDASGNTKLEMAESITPSADGLTVTVKLKPNLKYSDGTAVTSADIKDVADRQLNGGANSVFIASVKSVDIVDTLTAKLNLKYPDPDLLNGLSARAMALNPAAKVAADKDYFLHPVSAGPYMVKEYTPNKSFTMVENPNFVGGPMVVKQIEVVNVPDATSKVLQLNNKAIDFAWDIPIAAKDSLTKDLRQFTIHVGGANTLYLNMDPTGKAGAKFADARVRQAISLALDRQAIADTAFLGLVKPLTSFWYDCPDICTPGMLPNGGKQDVAAAKALMAAAGVTSISAEMLVSSTRGGWKEGATIVAQQLQAIGVNLTVNPVDEATWNAATAANNFETIFNGGATSPQVTMASWFGNGFSATHSGYIKTPNHDAVVALIDKMAQELDVTKRKALMTQIQTIGKDTMPYVPIVERIALDGIWLPPDALSVADVTPGYIIMQTVAEQAAGKGAGK